MKLILQQILKYFQTSVTCPSRKWELVSIRSLILTFLVQLHQLHHWPGQPPLTYDVKFQINIDFELLSPFCQHIDTINNEVNKVEFENVVFNIRRSRFPLQWRQLPVTSSAKPAAGLRHKQAHRLASVHSVLHTQTINMYRESD